MALKNIKAYLPEQKVTKEEAIAMMKQEFPKLKRWQKN